MNIKTDIIRARVDVDLKNKFEEVCKKMNLSPSEQMRELVRRFVNDYSFDYGICTIDIVQHQGYEYGAWEVTVRLSTDLKVKNITSFDIPNLENRIFHAEHEYLVASFRDGKPELYAKVVDKCWIAHLYTNGVAEDVNETSIERVKKALFKSVAKAAGIRIEDLENKKALPE